MCTDMDIARKEYGALMAKKIRMRMKEMLVSPTVEFMIQSKLGRCHQLTGNRNNEYAVDLVHPYRLVFEKVNNQIHIVNILEIVDYH